MSNTLSISNHDQLVIRWLPVAVWMLLIFTLSSQTTLPGAQIFLWDYLLKKSAHITVYAILMFLLSRGFNWGKSKSNWQFLWPFVITFLYAVSDELHQSTVPGRHPQVLDIGYDSLGAGIAFLRLKHAI